jgi:hypothetical protein
MNNVNNIFKVKLIDNCLITIMKEKGFYIMDVFIFCDKRSVIAVSSIVHTYYAQINNKYY